MDVFTNETRQNKGAKMKYVALIVLLLSSGCMTMGPIKYTARTKQDASFGTGYFDKHINKDIYSVGFLGNGKNTPEDVRDKFIRRSKEVSKQKGFKGFCIIKEGPQNGGYPNKAVWYGHQGDIKLTNKLDGDMCFQN